MRHTFNARAEGIEKAGMCKRALRRRCLVPADSFYQWHNMRPKNNLKYEIALSGGKPFAFAGLWAPGTTLRRLTWLQSYTIHHHGPNELMGDHPHPHAGHPPPEGLRPLAEPRIGMHRMDRTPALQRRICKSIKRDHQSSSAWLAGELG